MKNNKNIWFNIDKIIQIRQGVKFMLKSAIVGMGFIGNTHANAHMNVDNLELVAVVDMNEELGRKAAAKYSVKYYKDMQVMLQNEAVDIVDICVPTWLHEQCIELATRYKKHIICEKPITLNIESFDRIVDMVKKAGVRFMVAQVIRFWPEYARVTELYNTGVLGDVDMVYAGRLSEFPKWSTWHHIPEKSGGCLFDLSIHDLDYLRYLFGEVDCVYAVGHKSKTGCWDHVSSSITFKNGVNAIVEGTYEMFGGFPFTMSLRVHGSKSIVDYVLNAGHNLEDVDNARRQLYIYEQNNTPKKLCVEMYDAYQAEIRYFADCVANNKPNDKMSVESSRETLKLVLAVKDSLETGRKIIL